MKERPQNTAYASITEVRSLNLSTPVFCQPQVRDAAISSRHCGLTFGRTHNRAHKWPVRNCGDPARRQRQPRRRPCRRSPALPMTVGSSSVWRLLAGMMARPRATWGRQAICGREQRCAIR